MHRVTWHPHDIAAHAQATWHVPDGIVHLTLAAEKDLAASALVLVGGAGLRIGRDQVEPLAAGQAHHGKRGVLMWRRERATAPGMPLEITAANDPPRPGGAFVLEVGAKQVPIPQGAVLLVGRSPLCHVQLHDEAISAYHCALVADGCGVHVVDLGSRNGTWLAGTQVHAAFVTSPAALRLARRQLALRPKAEADERLVVLPSREMRRVYETARRVAASRAPVIVQGETGTGKEGLARAVHQWSGRQGRFVPINAAVLSSALAASELFGHVRGAFTGAHEAAPGAFVCADRGTLFLDEIAELRLEVQAELLRVLESGEVRPVGSAVSTPVDVRLITATHCDLGQRVIEGRFRADLFHRIWVLPIHLPPLRDRKDDVDALAQSVLARQSPPRRLTARARNALRAYSWRGNIRELINVLDRACVLTDDDELDIADLRLPLSNRGLRRMSGIKRESVVAAWVRHQGNVAAAARELGVHRATLFRYLQTARQAGELTGLELGELEATSDS